MTTKMKHPKNYTAADIEASRQRIKDAPARDMKALTKLQRLHEERVKLDEEIAGAVAAARADGWSWGVIAVYLEVSPQAVHKRYAAVKKG